MKTPKIVTGNKLFVDNATPNVAPLEVVSEEGAGPLWQISHVSLVGPRKYGRK